MLTREIEAKNYIRASVESAEVICVGDRQLILKTFSVSRSSNVVSSADSEMFDRQNSLPMDKVIEGRIKIDVCTDDVIRLRYSEGTEVPENITPMIAGSFPAPQLCRIDSTKKSKDNDLDKVVLVTNNVEIAVHLSPYSIEIREKSNSDRILISGQEKDFFNQWDSVNTGLCYLPMYERPISVENFSLEHNECIYGFGETFIRLNKVGQTIDLNLLDATGVTTPRSYKNIPFFVSNKGYGVFFNHSSLMTFWVGSMSACDLQVAIDDNFIDYYVFLGSIKKVLKNYTTLTGKGVLPPKWSFGFWQSKISYSSAEETLEISKRMRENQIPCDVIHLDTFWFTKDWYCNLEFDKERFPDPSAYIKTLAQMGIKVSLWQLPYIPEGCELFDKLKNVGGFVKNKDGEIYDIKVCFVEGFHGIVGVVDYTNPLAVKIHQDAFKKLFRMGVKVIKTDFGEAAPLDGIYFDGTPGYKMHNLYPLLYNQAIFEVTKEETGDGVVWARSAWAGSQRYPLHWGGDSSPNYMNMVPQLAGGLSLGLSGFQFWSQDIGGFLGNTSDELLTRWMQTGMLLSHSRIHGIGNRELYSFKPETIQICREYIRLRYRLLPYIYGSSMQCVEDSLPMARALVIEYQNDPNVWNISDQYLLGDYLMIAPIFDECNQRRVYLPEGVWTNWWTGERLSGNRWIHVEAALDILPVYIREGAIIPLCPVMNYVDEIVTEDIDLIISLFENENSSNFIIPVNDKLIHVMYEYSNGQHIIKIEKSHIRFCVKTYGTGAAQVVYEI